MEVSYVTPRYILSPQLTQLHPRRDFMQFELGESGYGYGGGGDGCYQGRYCEGGVNVRSIKHTGPPLNRLTKVAALEISNAYMYINIRRAVVHCSV